MSANGRRSPILLGGCSRSSWRKRGIVEESRRSDLNRYLVCGVFVGALVVKFMSQVID